MVGGRWLLETAHFLRALAVAKVLDFPNILQASVEVVWFRRWSNNAAVSCSCVACVIWLCTVEKKKVLLSQAGPMAGEPFSSFPTTKETRFDSQPSRLLLLRRLRLPLPLYCLPLPMWPSLGRLWPSSRVRHSWSVGEAWVCIGVSRRKGLLRGREKGEDERACEGT